MRPALLAALFVLAVPATLRAQDGALTRELDSRIGSGWQAGTVSFSRALYQCAARASFRVAVLPGTPVPAQVTLEGTPATYRAALDAVAAAAKLAWRVESERLVVLHDPTVPDPLPVGATHGGRTLHAWRADLLAGTERGKALEALVAAGPPARSTLAAALGGTDGELALEVAQAVAASPELAPEVVRQLIAAPPANAWRLEKALEGHGGAAALALVEALPGLPPSRRGRFVALALRGDVPPPAVDALRRVLAATSGLAGTSLRARTVLAASALASARQYQGQDPSPLLPLLADALTDRDPELRRAAAQALVAVVATRKKDAPAPALEPAPFIACLADADAGVRAAAATVLASVRAAPEALTPLTARALDPAETAQVLVPVALALGRLGQPATRALLAALRNNLEGKGLELREAFIVALSTLGPEAVPQLVQALRDPRVHVREAVASALGRTGPPAAEAVPALVSCFADVDGSVRVASVNAVGELGPTGEQALIDALAHPDARVTLWATVALARRPALAARAAPGFVSGVRHTAFDMRVASLEALGAAGPAAALAVPTIVGATSDEVPAVRAAALRALGRIGQGADQAVPALAAALADADAGVRSCALSALADFGEAALPAAGALLGRLQAEPGEAAHAATALGKLGPAAPEEVRAALLAAAERGDESLRREALTALVSLAPRDDASALDAILRALDGAKPGQRDPVERAIAARAGTDDAALRAVVALAAGRPYGIADLVELLPPPRRAELARRLLERDSERFAHALHGVDAATVASLSSAALASRERKVRGAALEALRAAPDAVVPSLPALAAVVAGDEDGSNQRRALELLVQGEAAAAPHLIDAIRSPRCTVRREAFEAYHRLGAPPLPLDALVGLLSDYAAGQVARERLAAAGVDAVEPLRVALRGGHGGARAAAAELLGRLGAQSAPAAPDLAALLGDQASGHAAREALKKLGPAALPAVIAVLEATHPTAVWREAIEVVKSFGAAGRPAAAALVRLHEHPDTWVRHDAARGLEAIGGSAEASSAVEAGLLHPDPARRQAAASTAEKLGEHGVPLLRRALADPSVDVRRAAIEGLRRLGPTGVAAAPDLVPLLADEDLDAVARAALVALGPGAAPALIGALTHASEKARSAAAEALGRIGPPDEAIAPLAAALDDAHPWVKLRAAEALGKAGPRAASAAPALRAAYLRDGTKERHRSDPFVRALGCIGGAPAVEFLEFLRAELAAPERSRRASAVHTLAVFGETAPDLDGVVAALGGALATDADAGVRGDAADRLDRLQQRVWDTPLRSTVAAALGRATQDPSSHVRGWAADGLAGWVRGLPDAEAAVALDAVLAALERAEPGFDQEKILTAMRSLGPRGAKALPLLRRLANEGTTPEVRQAAANAVQGTERQ